MAASPRGRCATGTFSRTVLPWAATLRREMRRTRRDRPKQHRPPVMAPRLPAWQVAERIAPAFARRPMRINGLLTSVRTFGRHFLPIRLVTASVRQPAGHTNGWEQTTLPLFEIAAPLCLLTPCFGLAPCCERRGGFVVLHGRAELFHAEGEGGECLGG